MSQTSIRPISIPQSPTRMSRARSRTTTQVPATGAMTSSSASHSSSLSPDKLHLKSSTKSSLRPSSLSSSSRAAAKSDTSTAMPSLDINIRDFFADGDTSVLKFMDEASIIREQARALQNCHDATLARTLQISQETAVTEAEARIKSKGKAKERTSNMDERGKTSSSLSSGKDVCVLGQTSVLVPAFDSVTKEANVRHEVAGQSLPQELLFSKPPPTMTVPPLPTERYSPDGVAARTLAEEWRASSFQDALLAHADAVHPPVPVSASPSTSSSSSSASSSLFSPASTTSTALSSPLSSPIASLPSSSSASAAARKSDALPTHAIPMTIPAEAFYSRSSHKRQSSSSTRSSTTSSSLRSSPPQNSLTPSPAKDKPLPLHPSPTYTSASSAAAALVAANSPSPSITTLSSSTLHSEKNRISPTRASFPSSVSSSRSVSSSPSTSSASASSRARGNSKIISLAESKSSAQKSAQSPEREYTYKSAGSSSSYTNTASSAAAASTPGVFGLDKLRLDTAKAHARTSSSSSAKSPSTATFQDTSSRVEREPEESSRTSLRRSFAVPQPSFQQANFTATSASVVAAERERARLSASTSTSTSSASAAAAAAAAKRSAAASPPRTPHQRDLSLSSIPSSSSTSVSAVSQRAHVPEPNSHPKEVLIQSTYPRNTEELFSAPRVREMEKSMVVPISSLSESDDEDDGDYDDDDGEQNVVQLIDEKNTDKTGVEEVDVKSVSFVDIYTAIHSCSKCGESIPFSNNLLILTAPTLHVTCPKCSTIHCRGCSRPAKCPKNCSGSKSCVINNCCSQVRAIAIFEALSIFDREYLLEAGLNSGNKDRDEFVRALISNPLTSQSRKVESILAKAMIVITEIFKTSDCQPFPPSSPSSIALCFEVVEFFEHSLLAEVIRAFLDSTNVRDWITHSTTYAVMLDLLRYMLEGGSTSICGIMDVQLRRIEKSCGLGEWLLGRGEIDWVSEGGAEKERLRQEERYNKQKKGETFRGQLRGGEEKHNALASFHANPTVKIDERKHDVAFAIPLKDLIPGLEKYRKSLWELSARITLASTVERLNMLCDRISQLALSQVIGV